MDNRSETLTYTSDDTLSSLAENIARGIHMQGRVPSYSIVKDLQSALHLLEKRRASSAELFSGEAAPPLAEWLLDNCWLARREGLSAAAELRDAGKLPACSSGSALLFLCTALIRSGKGRITERRCSLFLEGWQKVYMLTGRELRLFSPTLKAAAIIELAHLYKSGETMDDNAPAMAGALFSTLRLLSSLDLGELVKNSDRAEQLLSQDPAEIYPLMSEKTRNSYRRKVEQLAKSYRVSEYRVAEKALRLARAGHGEMRHVGYWLFTRPMGGDERPASSGLYVLTLCILSIIIALSMAVIYEMPGLGLIALLPISELIKSLIDMLLLKFTPPCHVPRMELEDGVPYEGRTICVISSLLTDKNSANKLARRLAEYRFVCRNEGENLLFGILADLPDSDEQSSPSDEETLLAAKKAIDRLNSKYGGGFFFFARDRVYNKRDKRYMAWERKRGAILELAQLICGRENGIRCLSGSSLGLSGVKYILTLDEDTRLTPGSAGELIGAMLHPLNKPVIDEKKGVVVSGHGLLHPRMTTELSSCTKSRFTEIFAGPGGADPYGSDSSELYMDIFQSGSFAGKGILDAEVFVACMDGRIPENRVLSHDALEGAFLRGGYMGDTELLDSYPGDLLSYFRRMHRWTRGDWQNAPWIFGKGSALAEIDRFRLFDNLRRSLLPPLYLTCFLIAFFSPLKGFTAAALISLAAIGLRLCVSVFQSLFHREDDVQLRCMSRTLRGVNAALTRTLLSLVFLPYEAYILASAALTALWRMLFSKRRFLDWTPASVSDGMANGWAKYLVRMAVCPLTGLLILLLSRSVMGMATAIPWLLAPFFAFDLSRRPKPAPEVPQGDRSYLLRRCRDIWSFFCDFCTAEDNFLPPDNWQEQPPVGTAHRTSPTNIGLCLLGCITALDLEIATRESALSLVAGILSTLKRMPKHIGHLFNWYDTRTLKPLHPAYVSTVDSGNLAVCLMILREALKELDEDALAASCAELLEPMSFAPLYDKKRRLFSIGLDVETGKLSKSLYDLMASEARTAGYVAIVRGDVPYQHWRALSRAQVGFRGYRGMVSWTGSMFEYMMPRLFFKSAKGSAMYESLRFCSYVQRMRSAPDKLPWGISESAYFSLDPALNYRYKAHGCAALALKRGMDAELVISPYSSFLAMNCGKKRAISNLRALEIAGAGCRYGFWEAIDFTRERSAANRGEPVRCVMAHHLGMSLVAAGNLLCDDLMCKRLMRDPAVAAYSCLLDEKLPQGGLLLRRHAEKAPEKPPRKTAVYWERRGDFYDPTAPVCGKLSNGVYSVILTDSGCTSASCGELVLYKSAGMLPALSPGISFGLIQDGSESRLLPTISTDGKAKSDWYFTFSGAGFNSLSTDVRSQIKLSVSASENGEKRVISVSPQNGLVQSCELLVSLEPILAPLDDYVNHPAFWQLGIHAKLSGGALILHRLSRGRTPDSYMCIAFSEPAVFSARGEHTPGRCGEAALPLDFTENGGWLYRPYVCARLPIRLAPGCDSAVTMAISLGDSENKAYSSACRILISESSDTSNFPADSAAWLGLSEREAEDAMELFRTIAFPAQKAAVDTCPKDFLWRFGISGDLPILAREIKDEDALKEAETLIKQHSFLWSLSQPFDLILVTNEGGDYMRPLGSALRNLRSALCGEVPNILIVDRSDGGNELLKYSVFPRERMPLSSTFDYVMSTSSVHMSTSFPQYIWNDEGSFEFYVNHSLPPRIWSHMLTNGNFGYLASDCGAGNMWYKNARECPITPRCDDAYALSGAESFTANGKSLFAAADDENCTVTYGFGYARWKKRIDEVEVTTTAFVPSNTDARVFVVEWTDDEELDIHWSARLSICGDMRPSSVCRIDRSDTCFTAHNPSSPFPSAPLHICASEKQIGFTTNREIWLRGETDNECINGGFLGLRFRSKSPFILVCGCGNQEALLSLCKPSILASSLSGTLDFWQNAVGRFKMESSLPSLDRLMNGWLPYQTLACRLMGRCSIYQSGGAVGFRDQLQDAVNLILLDSSYARSQIIECCLHQYREGDVMHWWHQLESSTRGVRTRCSDDLLWLPWALCEYCEKTGDISLCSHSVPWLSSNPLDSVEHDRYELAEFTPEASEVLTHCMTALDMVLSRGTGDHGLLKIGGGDWNDGMDSIGIDGQGESVWLTWFFSHTAHRFALLLEQMNRPEEAKKYSSAAENLGLAANKAWDGSWYLRGYFDDGTPLGSQSQSCCKIDSIAQSFAVLCPEADDALIKTALDSAVTHLFDEENGIVSLFTPPFENAQPSPGYIESYGPGFRENGGQYTHGAMWLIMALLRENRIGEGIKLLEALIPESHDGAVYQAEPYVIAADVYSCPDCVGAAGWSWYTGSAGWFFRVVTEDLLGLRMKNGKISLEPKHLEGFSCTLSLKDKDGKVFNAQIGKAEPNTPIY